MQRQMEKKQSSLLNWLPLQDNFVFPQLLVAHLDGKIRKQWGTKSDFLALCVTGKGLSKEKVLGDVPLPKGTGRNMATAAVNLFKEWGIDDDQVWGSGFDTTLSMTGHNQG